MEEIKMKKLRNFAVVIAFAILVTLAFSVLTGCGSDNNNDTRGDDSAEISQPPSTQGNEDDTTDPQSSNNDEYLDDVDERVEDLSLSGVLYDFTFKLDGDTITLPLTLGEFQSLGWAHSEFIVLPETLEGHTRLLGAMYYKNDVQIWIPTINVSEDELPIEESMVYKIESSIDDENYAVIELPRGIILGESTKDDVIEAFGWPTWIQEWDDDEFSFLTYESESFGLATGIWGPSANKIEITTSNERNNIIVRIVIENIS
jgi:hypothetical protein